MDIFTESSGKKDALSAIMVDKKEGRLIVEMIEFYCGQNKRKKIAARILKQLHNGLGIY